MANEQYADNVFINCPFDPEYAPIFEAIVFAVNDAGFRPKCARERLDSSQVPSQDHRDDLGISLFDPRSFANGIGRSE
jgi:hypothetical protein